jgi:hypothetical protein
VRRLLRAFPFTIAAILVLGGGIAFAAHSMLTTTSGSVPPGSPGDPAVAGKPVLPTTGVPAITPSLVGHVPAFTERDVRAHLAIRPFSLGRTPSGGSAPIASVQFITREQAEVLIENSLSEVAPGHIVCYVKFAGPLVATGLAEGPHFPPLIVTPGQTPAPSAPQTFASGYMVFDATTGNLLVAGI